MKSRIALLMVVIAAMLLIAGGVFPASESSIDLSGDWKFQVDPTNSGLAKGWHASNCDTSQWRKIEVPGIWEDQGITQTNPNWGDETHRQYTGYAWYRRSVVIPSDWRGEKIYLNLGRIDDMDWTYVNGKLIGQTSKEGTPPPSVCRFYSITLLKIQGNPSPPPSSVYRSYTVPADIVKFGQPNVITVRVLDYVADGGIVEGPMSLTLKEPLEYPSNVSCQVGDRTSLGHNVIIEANETVRDPVAICGNVIVKGHVVGDAVAVMGDVKVREGGRIDGDATAVGGTVSREPGAFIGGEITSISMPLWGLMTAIPMYLLPISSMCLLLVFLKSVLFAILAAVIVALFPARIGTIADVVLERPGWSFIYGFVGLLLILPIALILIITCIGIPLVAVEAILVLAVEIAGYIGVALAIGRRVGEAVHRPISSGVLAAVIGSLILGVIHIVPAIGVIVGFFLSLMGAGAVLITGFGASPAWFHDRFGHG